MNVDLRDAIADLVELHGSDAVISALADRVQEIAESHPEKERSAHDLVVAARLRSVTKAITPSVIPGLELECLRAVEQTLRNLGAPIEDDGTGLNVNGRLVCWLAGKQSEGWIGENPMRDLHDLRATLKGEDYGDAPYTWLPSAVEALEQFANGEKALDPAALHDCAAALDGIYKGIRGVLSEDDEVRRAHASKRWANDETMETS